MGGAGGGGCPEGDVCRERQAGRIDCVDRDRAGKRRCSPGILQVIGTIVVIADRRVARGIEGERVLLANNPGGIIDGGVVPDRTIMPRILQVTGILVVIADRRVVTCFIEGK